MALKHACIELPLCIVLPNVRLTSLATGDDVLPIGRNRALNFLVAALGAEEPFADASAARLREVEQSDAVVTGLDIDLLLDGGLRMHDNLVDLITVDLLVLDEEVVADVDVVAVRRDSPDIDLAGAVTDE